MAANRYRNTTCIILTVQSPLQSLLAAHGCPTSEPGRTSPEKFDVAVPKALHEGQALLDTIWRTASLTGSDSVAE